MTSSWNRILCWIWRILLDVLLKLLLYLNVRYGFASVGWVVGLALSCCFLALFLFYVVGALCSLVLVSTWVCSGFWRQFSISCWLVCTQVCVCQLAWTQVCVCCLCSLYCILINEVFSFIKKEKNGRMPSYSYRWPSFWSQHLPMLVVCCSLAPILICLKSSLVLHILENL